MRLDFTPCRNSYASKLGRYSALLLYPFAGVLLLLTPFVIVFDIYQDTAATIAESILLLITSGISLIMSIFMFKLSICCYQMEKRQIHIDKFGVTLKSRQDRQYYWKQIYGIGVIAYAASASKQNYQTEICIFLEPFDENKLRRLRDSYLYGVFNPKCFILIDYDLCIVEELERCSGLSVPDLRTEQMKL